MKFALSIFIVLISITTFAQNTITINGKVVDENNHPLAYATVFINGSQTQTLGDDKGDFTITLNSSGIYVLVASMIGYANNMMKIVVNSSKTNIEIKLVQKTHQLKDVIVGGSDKDWARYYEIFKKGLLGQTLNARKCEIINPHVLHFFFNGQTKELSAQEDDFLTIINHTLGYKIKISFDDFKFNTLSLKIDYDVFTFYENLKGSKRQIDNWSKARLNTYLGSKRQFFKALYNNELHNDGFIVYKVETLDTTNLPSRRTIKDNINFYTQIENNKLRELGSNNNLNVESNRGFEDSLLKYKMMKQYSYSGAIYYHDNIPVNLSQYIIADSIFKILLFEKKLWIIYTKANEDDAYKQSQSYDWKRNSNQKGQETILSTNDPMRTFIFKNGQTLPGVFYFEGYFAWKRLGDELPIDYRPVQ